jgi:hypothetical protein
MTDQKPDEPDWRYVAARDEARRAHDRADDFFEQVNEAVINNGESAFRACLLGKVQAQARHGAGEVARVYANECALLCPAQLFLTALHGSGSALTLSLSPSRLPRGK